MIIGISGYIGSGKDTMAKMIQLISAYNNPHTRYRRTIDSWKEQHTLSQFVLELLKPQYEDKEFFHMGKQDRPWEIKKFAAKLKQMCSLLTGIPVEDFEKQSVKDSELGPEWDWWYYKRIDRDNQDEDVVPFDTIDFEMFKRRFAHIGADKMYQKPMTVRTLLQTLGTQAMRNQVHPNIHVNVLFADYKQAWVQYNGVQSLQHPAWIISDCRFPNEAQAIKDRGGIIVRVDRPETVTFSSSDFKPIAGTSRVGLNVKEFIDNQPKKHPSETSLDNWEFDWIIKNDSTLENLLDQVSVMLKENNLL